MLERVKTAVWGAAHRPATRFLHWLSHGVPAVTWKFEAYMDLMRESGYVLPSGKLPVVNQNASSLSVLLKEFLAPSVRADLRRKGLELAA
eukprot:3582226-Amphidinium_carterae.1